MYKLLQKSDIYVQKTTKKYNFVIKSMNKLSVYKRLI